MRGCFDLTRQGIPAFEQKLSRSNGEMNDEENGTVLVVDDDRYVLESVSLLLNEFGFSTISCEKPAEALNILRKQGIDAVLSDIKMPDMSGIELLGCIHDSYTEMPVILMTAYADLDIAIDAIKRGAFDFIIKPYNATQLLHSIKKALKYKSLVQMEKNHKKMLEETVEKRTHELAEALLLLRNMNRELMQRLLTVAEYRDTDTGAHIARIGLYSNKIAEAMNLPADFVEIITFASPMHDIGKVGIPDSILLKPASLTTEEFEIMKTHTTIGEKMLATSSYANIRMAASIAGNHHERWDGSGYPAGKKGEEIPLESRIVIICDQYDALMSLRPYKKPLTHAEVVRILTEGDGRTMPAHFDPAVLKAFIEIEPIFEQIFKANTD